MSTVQQLFRNFCLVKSLLQRIDFLTRSRGVLGESLYENCLLSLPNMPIEFDVERVAVLLFNENLNGSWTNSNYPTNRRMSRHDIYIHI